MPCVTILIVEDNRHMRRALVAMLRRAFDATPVIEAADATSALALCRESPPDLVLMDVGLPDGSGIDLTAKIKAMLPESQVVIVSNHWGRASRDAAKAAGAVAYVYKDEVYEKLLTTLTQVLTAQDDEPNRGDDT